MGPSVSVVTPAYQRADTLPRLYESLLAQSWRDFEWVVVDDGSDDGSRDLIAGWAREAPFPIEYSWQPNQGKHAAFNRCVERASGEFCALIDSDDWYLPRALAEMRECWRSIPAAGREGFANVEGLRVDARGEPIGERFPREEFDSDAFELRALHGIAGDTVGMYRRDVLRAFPFPEDLGWHVSPSLVWNRIAARYRTRFVNRVWAGTEYGEDGLSASNEELRLRFAEAQLLFWREYVAMPRQMSKRNRFRAHANLVRYSLLTGVSPRHALSSSPRPAWTLMAAPAGLALARRDRPALDRLLAEAS